MPTLGISEANFTEFCLTKYNALLKKALQAVRELASC